MNIKLNTLASVIAISLTACGGSTDNQQPPSGSQLAEANVAADAPAPVAENTNSTSLAGTPSTSSQHDLTISNLTSTGTFDTSDTVNYRFTISDNDGGLIPVDQLSVALEISASGSFKDTYNTALFDLRTEGNSQSSKVTFSARSAPIDLPSGSYMARLIVNPNWQYAFDTVPDDHNHDELFRYVSETDFSNNASNAFQIAVDSATVCAEDGYEGNNSLQNAHPLPVGGLINSALCLDNVDIYSVELGGGEKTSISFDYTDTQTNSNPASRYVIIDPTGQTHVAPRVARETSKIIIEAYNAGTYYLALYGQRSSYRLSRSSTLGPGVGFDDVVTNVFTGGTLNGPQSWLFGDITLQKLKMTEDKIVDQVVNCGRITTQFNGDKPVAYVTPSHFADIHKFRFQPGGEYLIDAEPESSWTIANGDISASFWYANDYPGYAERISNTEWRYWSADGLSYVECTLQVN